MEIVNILHENEKAYNLPRIEAGICQPKQKPHRTESLNRGINPDVQDTTTRAFLPHGVSSDEVGTYFVQDRGIVQQKVALIGEAWA